ncbi:MAG: TRAP transporter substrate-binding protein [Devosia sp.]|uniref:TRAP transporter substrate-binding protein n=1 Tax=Devosia sp. TaxID=1871048 RepID=UPI0024CBE007|nr:TRAP transporter substrate-binding protein [Devosia sp.]UYN99040.1 MAG: TRAP transporter substrate-binding protein [Devosia sp.]
MKIALGLLMGTTALLSAMPGTLAQELTLSSWLPPRHPIVVNAIIPWSERVADVTEGRVTVRVLAKALGAPPAHFDMAADGIADITYGLHSFTTDDRFERSRIGQFSFIGDDARTASTAFWNVYSGQLDAQSEHEGVHLLGLFVHGPGVLYNNKLKIESQDDLAGLKIRVPGGYVSELLGGLGAETLFMSSDEVYEKLSRGVIDGVAFTYEALTAFNVINDLSYGMRVPGGLYNTTWFMVMNEGAWEGISEADRAAIDAISGPAFAELVGEAWNGADSNAIAEILASGIEIYDAPADFLAEIKANAAVFEQEWADSIAEDGFDGTAALAALRAETRVEF